MSEQTRLRPEIQVLRAIAVLAVVGNHLFRHAVSGGFIGVDVFFVISGYLITAHLLRELDGSGRVRLGAFWARRARRLIPASAVVLASCAVATVAFVPRTLWQEVMRQIVSSALFVQNWTLAHDSQDYFRSAESPSPVTHYWSLSLEEQFYLVWPLLIFGAYVVGRRLGSPRRALGVVVGVVVIASLAYSIIETARNPNPTYFVTPARAWQLGLGGLVAMVPPAARARRLTGAVGWIAILSACFAFTESTPVPGWIALIPVLGTCLVIRAGDVFMAPPVRVARAVIAGATFVGGISYSLYLWHWPLIVLVPYADGRPLTTATRLVLLAVSLLVAWLSARYVEDAVRRWRPLAAGPIHRTLAPAAGVLVVIVLGANAAGGTVDRQLHAVTQDVQAAAAGQTPCFGARAVEQGCRRSHRLTYRDSTLITRVNYTDLVHNGEVCLQTPTSAAITTCDFGAGPAAASTVALVGDSHSRHWSEAVDALAAEHDWRVQMMAKGSCPLNGAAVTTKNFPQYADSCHQWVEAVTRRLVEDPSIKVVFTSSYSRNYHITGMRGGAAKQAMADGYAEVWRRLLRAGKTVVVLADVPQPHEGDIPTCVSEADTIVDPCSVPRARAATPDPLLTAARATRSGRLVTADLTRYFCDHATCHVVIGGVVAYGDDNHMIGYFARTLAPYLDRQLDGRLPDDD